jgi:hypothetical protein
MNKVFCSLLILLTSVVYAQKVVYDPNVVQRSTTSFKSIQVSGGIDLHLTNGDEAVAVSASEAKYRDQIKTQVVNNVLKIWFDHDEKNLFVSGKRLKAYVAFKHLESLSASGGSDVIIEGAIRGDNLNLQVSGGSDFQGKVQVKSLAVIQSGGSDIKISGAVNSVNITSSGGSDFKGYDLLAETCTVQATGGSDVEISVNKELNANASGGSDISYKGNAIIREKKTSSSSSVSRKS